MKAKQCRANTGIFWGHRCELPRGHDGPHKVVIVSVRDIAGRLTPKTTLEWGASRTPRDGA